MKKTTISVSSSCDREWFELSCSASYVFSLAVGFRFLRRTLNEGGYSFVHVSFLPCLCFLQFSSLGAILLSQIIKRYTIAPIYEMCNCSFDSFLAWWGISFNHRSSYHGDWLMLCTMQCLKNARFVSMAFDFINGWCSNLLDWCCVMFMYRLNADLREQRHYLKELFPRPLIL